MASDQGIHLLSTQSTLPMTITTYLVNRDKKQPELSCLWIAAPAGGITLSPDTLTFLLITGGKS